MAEAEFVTGKKSRIEYRAWTRWMNAAAELANRYCKAMPDDDDDAPYLYNETATVSMLAAAAACAGYVGLAEFSTTKANRLNRAHGHGRSDFWMLGEGRSWSFEFKQLNALEPPRRKLETRMAAAVKCAGVITKGTSDAAVAGLVVPLHWIRRGERRSRENNLLRARLQLREFAEEECDYAWHLARRDGPPETWFLFKLVRQWV